MNKQLIRCLLFLWVFQLSPTLAWSQNSNKIAIFTSILPQKFFVEQLAGDLAEVEVLVGPGMSPHTFEPLPQQMSRLSRAAIFFTIGVPFENVLSERLKSVCPDLKIIPTDTGVERQAMQSFDNDHHHDTSCTHSEGEPDPHIWLDPDQVIIQAKNIAVALKEVLPNDTAAIDVNLASFTVRLKKLSEELSAILLPVKGQTMLVFHPSFGYFARRFGLNQQPIEMEGKEPGPRQLGELIKKCKAENVHIIFVQKQFPVAAAEALANAINGAVIQIDPLAENYFANLTEIARAVAEALQNK